MYGIMTAHDAKELTRILKRVKNVNDDATLDFKPETQKETWFDKWVFRWF